MAKQSRKWWHPHEFEQIENDGTYKFKVGEEILLACCDCGLVHGVKSSNRTTLSWTLKPSSTKAHRKKHAKDLDCRPKDPEDK